MAELPPEPWASPRSCGIPGLVPTPQDDASDDLSGWIADRLTSARVDAERIAGELLRDGRISAEEVEALRAAVERAIERGSALIGDALREPRRILAGLRRAATSAAPGADDPGRVRSATETARHQDDDPGTPGGPAAGGGTPAPDDAAARIARLEARVAVLEALVTRGAESTRGADGDGI